MISFKFSLMIALVPAFVFMGCSSDSSTNPMDEVNIFSKPSSPASREDIKHYIESVNNVEKVMPGFDSVLNRTISGDEVEYSGDGSEIRRKANEKLNASGKKAVEKIKELCLLQDATKKTDGNLEKQGDSQKITLSQKVDGKNCPVEMVSTTTVQNTINKLVIIAGEVQSGEIVQSQNYTNSITNKNIETQRASNIKKATMDVTMSFITMMNQGGISAIGDINGRANIVTADGEVIKAIISGRFDMDSASKMNLMRVLAQITTPRGDIHLGYQSENDKTKIYLNGEEIDPSQFGKDNFKLGLILAK